MEEYENMYKNICRMCLSQSNSDKMVTLIDNSSEDGLSSFGKAIRRVTNVFLQKDDELPSMMCQKCIYLLKLTIYFKLKCESTDKLLKRLVNNNVNSGTSNSNVKEIICEYVLFTQYFPENQVSGSSKHNAKVKKRINRREKPVKAINFMHETDEKVPIDQVEKAIDLVDKTYDFDDFTDNEGNINNISDQKEEYSKEINNILDTIQDITNGATSVTRKPSLKRKLKLENRYRPLPTKTRNLVCSVCHKILANRHTYNYHIQRHNNCKYICDQCGKGFPVLSELHRHQIVRHGIGPYLQCDHCPYKAPKKISLIEHLRLHTGERPFTCEKCGLTFRRKAIWRNHLVCHMEKQYQCTYCPRKFYRHCSMLAHCNNVHERMYMYMCSICSVTYTKTETVRRHMAVKHGIPREKQGRIMRVSTGNSEFPNKVN